jgi:phosphoenolpyruvate carboxykinase (ATP)
VPDEILQPESLWDDTRAYQDHYRALVKKFQDNFQRYAEGTPEAVRQAGPRLT